METIKRFVALIDKRNSMIERRYGENLKEMLNFPDEREWYTENIYKIDSKILKMARQILPDEKFEKISDVYSNEFLINQYNEYKNDSLQR